MRISDWSSDVCSSDLQRRRRLRAADDPRDTRARMRPRADEVKVRNHIVAVVGAEPGALPEDRLETERAAEVCGQVAAEIGGRVVETRDEIGAEAGRHAARSEEHTSELQSLIRTSSA